MEANKRNDSHANTCKSFQTEYQKSKKEGLSYGADQTDIQIKMYKMKLAKYQKECQQVEKELNDANQLKDKGLFVLKNIQARKEALREDFKKIHNNFDAYIAKARNGEEDEIMSKEIEDLMTKQKTLTEELTGLKKVADENDKKLIEIRTRITAQEKKNMALLRKLKRQAETMNAPQDLRAEINAMLCDPRITQPNINDRNVI